MEILHERYPNYRGLLDPRRHVLFQYGDIRELAMLGIQTLVLSALLFLFSSFLFIPIVWLGALFKYADIHKHAKDPWYYPRQRAIGPQRWVPEASAFNTVPQADRFHLDERIANASLTPWQRLRRWFSKESFGTGNSTRYAPAGDIHRFDLPLFGLPALRIPGVPYPTGREIIMKLKRSPLIERLGLKPLIDSIELPTIERSPLSAALPWRSKPDRYTTRLKWEGYVRSWIVTGSAPDTTRALAMIKSRFDTALIHCHSGCIVHPLLSVTNDPEPFPVKPYPTEAAALAAHERYQQTETLTRVKVTGYVHLIYAPHLDTEHQIEGKTKKEVSLANYHRFVGIAANFQELLRHAWQTVVPLARNGEVDDQFQALALPLRFNTEKTSVPALHPDYLVSDVLGRHLLERDIAPDGTPTGFARLDNQLVAPIDLHDIEAPTIHPDDLRVMEGHEPPLLLSLRWIAMNPSEQRENTETLYKETGKRTEHEGKPLSTDEAMPNLAAMEDQQQTLQLDALLEKKSARLGHATITLALYEPIHETGLVETRRRLRARLNQLNGGLTNRRYTFAATTVNAVDAVLAMCPGNIKENIIVNPVPSGAIANLFTTYAPWLGSPVIRESLKNYIGIDGQPVPSLFFRVGLDRRRFAWAPQTGSRTGHGLIHADSGSGKSSLIAEMINEYLAYDLLLPHGARVILLDRDGSQKIHAALNHAAMLVLGDGATTGLDPFADVESEGGRELAQSVLEAMWLAKKGVLDKATGKEIDRVIAALHDRPVTQRDVDAALIDADAGFDFKERLTRYTSQFTGKLFSGTSSPFTTRYTYVDIAPAMASTELRLPVTLALMSAIERAAIQQRGPMFLIAEEFWELLRDPKWVDVFIGWLKRLRKFGVWIWLVTHSLGDLDVIKDNKELMKEQFRNHVILPSAKFYSDEAIERFREIGVSEDRIRFLAEHAPTEGGDGTHIAEIIQDLNHRVVPTHMGPVSLAVCGMTGEPDRKAFARVLQRCGGLIDDAFVEWIRLNGGMYREHWANEAQALVEHYAYQRAEAGIPPTRYDPKLFDPDINDVVQMDLVA